MSQKVVRQTSLEAYQEIKANGLLNKRRWQVYDLLFKEGPLTIFEICEKLEPGAFSGSFTSRVSELKRIGVVAEVGITKNKRSGKRAILWDVTDRLPEKIEKTSKKKLRFGVASNNFGEPGVLFKTKGEALRYKINKRISHPIQEFEEK